MINQLLSFPTGPRSLKLRDWTISTTRNTFLSRNAPHSVHLSQDEVNWLFEGDVQATYGQDHPKGQFLLQQISSPLTMDFWDKYTDPEKFVFRKSQEPKTSFRALPRDKHNQHDGAIILRDGITKILIPDIDRFSLQNVKYLDVVRNIYQANGGGHISAAKMGRIWEGIVINVYHFEPESTKTCKLAEATSQEAKNYWRMLSDYRLALRQQRIRPVAADFFDDYPKYVDREHDHVLGTIARPRPQIPSREFQIVDAGPVLANENQPYKGKSKKTQEFLSQLFVFGGPPRYADDGTAFNSDPSFGLGHRFRKTFGPVTSVDANGTIIDESDHSFSQDTPTSGSSPTADEYSKSALSKPESRDIVGI